MVDAVWSIGLLAFSQVMPCMPMANLTFTSAEEGGYVFATVCLSVCVSTSLLNICLLYTSDAADE